MLTKKEVEEKLSQIKTNIPNSAKKLSDISEFIFALGIIIGVLCCIAGVYTFFQGGFFAIIIGAVIFLTYWIISLVFNGFSELIKNTYKSSEYDKLQVEMLTENIFKEVSENTEDDSLPTL